jgi:hypothetical protein
VEDNVISQILNTLKNNGYDNSPLVTSFYATHELSPEHFHIEVGGLVKSTFRLIKQLSKSYRIFLRKQNMG